ncbi:WD repeat-containing protein 53 [Boothiomyces sp. JEL0866]|nr:WD repeat-containing protein 53 [Boothiomyces sp. JEL0866]
MLVGHSGAINYLHNDHHRLISCGNDCAILWDINSLQITNKIERVMNQAKLDGSNIYFTSGNTLHLLDTRTDSVQSIYTATDDINEFDLHFNSKFVGFVDDTGKITVLDNRNYKPFKNFKNGHSNIAACFKFRPTLPWQCATGGFDCFVKAWDFSRASLQSEFSAISIASDTFNPPFIYSLAFDKTGNKMAAGLGDGKVCIFTDIGRNKSSLPGKFQILERHSWSISGLKYDADTLYSTSIDKTLIKWDSEPIVTSFDFKLNCVEIASGKVFVAGTADSKSQFSIHIIDK